MADVRRVKVRFPLAWKLSLVVSAILVFSLGVIILAVWLLFRFDTAAAAAADNDSINFRVAAAVESTLDRIRSETILLLSGAPPGGAEESADSAKADAEDPRGRLVSYYFSRNPSVAAVVSLSPDGRTETMTNGEFISSGEISASLITEYLNMRGSRLLADSGETLLVNASGDFYGFPMLAARFPYTAGNDVNLAASSAIVLFSSGELAEYFGYGASRSFLLNSAGETLIEPGETLESSGAAPLLDEFFSGGRDHLMTNHRGKIFASVRRIDPGAALLTVIPGSVIFEEINATTRRNIYLAISVWFISLLFISLFASGLTRQLELLKEAAEAIENGHYRRRIRGKSRDETGCLAGSMDSMRTGLLNFERFTNKQIARLTRQGILKPGGTTKEAVFLFSDIRSFTAISETMDPAELVRFLNDYMERMVACITLTGGVIDKFIGDAILAHWGAIDEGNDDAPAGKSVDSRTRNIKAALRSSLLMRAALQCLNQNSGKNRPYVKIGCGIAGGKVAAGLIGTDERLVYTVIGEAVNLAEKAESYNKVFGTEILVPGRMLAPLGEDFIAESLPGLPGAGLSALINVRGGDETGRLLAELGRLPGINMSVARHSIGEDGPKTLRELRILLGIPEPDFTRIQTDEREKKFKVKVKKP